MFVHDHRAQLVLFHRFDDLVEGLRRCRVFEQFANFVIFLAAAIERFFDRNACEEPFAFLLIDRAHRFGDIFGERLTHPFIERRIRFVDRVLAFLFAVGFGELVDRGDDLTDLVVRERDGAEEIFLGDFFAFAFDHHHGVGGAGDDDVHATGFVLRQRGIADELTVLVASDAHRRNRFVERNVGER